MSQVGVVYLLGAGPGDPELITVRARRRLAEADVVLYDALVHPSLLDLCRPDATLEFVGKRAGEPSARQSRINARLVEAARAGAKVARLKGGDPYLFGRGSEEAEHLANEGIPFEVVPGVPSPVAATAYAGISLTHRTLSSSVAYVTATESEEKTATSHDWAKLATATQTLVIFMGMRRLEALLELLVTHGRPPETPAAVIHWASTPRQRVVVGTLADLAEKARAADLGLPSLILVGDVVRLREKLRWYDSRPLFGRRVLVTRAAHQAGSLARCLSEAGAEPLVAPTSVHAPPEDRGPLLAAARSLSSWDWILFTSVNTVDAVFEAVDETGGDARRFGAARVCAIGEKTASALRARGVRPDLVPADGHAEGVLAALSPLLSPESRVLLPRAAEAREVIPDGLRAAGHRCDVVEAYRVIPVEDAAPIRVALAQADAVTLASGAMVDALVAHGGRDALAEKILASIGPVTSARLRRHGLEPTVEAPMPTIEALVEALAAHYESLSR
ncbi:MAG: uroporphyrinogen-III C-methyltransferase [Myxococcales bacterium]|nr:uroporphyrinogen-III C-methyltransferase [Myxococcales bacterium]